LLEEVHPAKMIPKAINTIEKIDFMMLRLDMNYQNVKLSLRPKGEIFLVLKEIFHLP